MMKINYESNTMGNEWCMMQIPPKCSASKSPHFANELGTWRRFFFCVKSPYPINDSSRCGCPLARFISFIYIITLYECLEN